ncbi:hypothetical protein C8J57DRAFT_1232605 [Mycena rebaudengoi]|nr:hypothetical protein C8J57DRAFT_1232605 [Mycena rebaudengoi]
MPTAAEPGKVNQQLTGPTLSSKRQRKWQENPCHSGNNVESPVAGFLLSIVLRGQLTIGGTQIGLHAEYFNTGDDFVPMLRVAAWGKQELAAFSFTEAGVSKFMHILADGMKEFGLKKGYTCKNSSRNKLINGTIGDEDGGKMAVGMIFGFRLLKTEGEDEGAGASILLDI